MSGQGCAVSAAPVPGAFWERIAPLLPPRSARRVRHPGRLPGPDRVALTGIVYALRKRVAWRDVPAQVAGCSGVTCWRRLRDWMQAGTWSRRFGVRSDP
ncbi:transposase [Streptomyces hirsutus]